MTEDQLEAGDHVQPADADGRNGAGGGLGVVDLKAAFPDMRGWSPRNLKYMTYFAQHCPDGRFGQQPAAQLPWFHVVTLLTRLTSPAEHA